MAVSGTTEAALVIIIIELRNTVYMVCKKIIGQKKGSPKAVEMSEFSRNHRFYFVANTT